MVLVDTSVWISLYRQEDSILGQRLWALAADNQAAVCGQIWVEFLGGFRKEKERREYSALFGAYPFLGTDHECFKLAAEFLAKYPRLGAGDAIIAATAVQSSSPLWTLDKDFLPLAVEGLKLF